jgi:hypothetical protein
LNIPSYAGVIVWNWLAQVEVIEGIIVIGTALVIARLVRFDFGYEMHSRPRLPLVLVGIVSTISYAVLVLCNSRQGMNTVSGVGLGGVDLMRYPLGLLGFFGGSSLGPSGADGYGLFSLMVWVLAFISFSLGIGVARTMRLFTFPSMLFLAVFVLLVDPGEMSKQAVNVVAGLAYDGVSLLSNWLLLTVSLFFTVFLNLERRIGGNTEGKAPR